MEVHHHPEVEKKGLKEYLLEGLMIFIAVTMGFIAENIREGISDRAKGREYIRSFVQDLRTDTAAISKLTDFDQKKISALNSQFACFDSISANPRSTSCLVILVENSNFNYRLNFIDGTLEQLRNAGGFRLLNVADKDSIAAFDNDADAVKNYQSTQFQQQQDNIRNTYNMLGNYKANVELFPDSGKIDVQVPVLFTYDKPLLNRYFNDLFSYRRSITVHLSEIRRIKKRADGLIKYFEHKYNLE